MEIMEIIFSLLIQPSYKSKKLINHLILKEKINLKNKKLGHRKRRVLQKEWEENKRKVIQTEKTKNNFSFFLSRSL